MNFVGHDRIRIGLADGECAVARLPMKIRKRRALGFDPFGRTGFHRLNHVGMSCFPARKNPLGRRGWRATLRPMEKVRLGIIGLGNIGKYHADYLQNKKISRCELVAGNGIIY